MHLFVFYMALIKQMTKKEVILFYYLKAVVSFFPKKSTLAPKVFKDSPIINRANHYRINMGGV